MKQSRSWIVMKRNRIWRSRVVGVGGFFVNNVKFWECLCEK